MVGLTVGDTADRWASLGFQPILGTIGADTAPMLSFDNGALICIEREQPTLIVARAVATDAGPSEIDLDVRGGAEIDGVPVEWVAPGASPATSPGGAEPPPGHSNGAYALDHIVLNTDSLERTSAAVERVLGLPLKRVREVGEGPQAVRQGFHRFADRGCIVEIVERGKSPTQLASAGAERPGLVTVFGVVAITDRLERLAADLGDELISAPRPAVQPGRSIATVRRAANLPLALAFMSPEPPPSGAT